LNERKIYDGDNTLQIKIKENVRHTTKRTEGVYNINASGQLTHSEATS
jgi:hypothetical protein